MATSTPMSLPLSLLFLSLILLLAPATKADITLFSSDHSDDNSMHSSPNRRHKINGGQILTDGQLCLVVLRDCSIYLFHREPLHLVLIIESHLATKDCYIYLSNRGVLYVHTNDIRIADTPIFGEETEDGRYALVLHRGTLAIYGPDIWSNGVGWNKEEVQQSAIPAARYNNVFYSGTVIEGDPSADVLVARLGYVSAYLRPDCTLAVQLENGTVLWSTWTNHAVLGQCKLEFKTDGDLVIRDYFANQTLFVEVFNSGHKSKDDDSYICLLWIEGELVIYGRKVWIYERPLTGIKMVTE